VFATVCNIGPSLTFADNASLIVEVDYKTNATTLHANTVTVAEARDTKNALAYRGKIFILNAEAMQLNPANSIG